MINGLSDGTIVIKIGGSQQKSHEDILNQALNIKKLYEEGHKVVAVLSAHNGNTEGIIKNSDNPWDWIKGEWFAVDYMRDLLQKVGVSCLTFKQNNGFPLIGDINAPEGVEANLEHLMADNLPALVAGFGLINYDGTLSLVRNGSDDVAAILASKLKNSTLIYQKDVRGIYYPWPDGELLREVDSSWLLDKVESGEISKVMSMGAIKVIHAHRINTHVCNLEYWLDGTEIYWK
ncbi:MAG: hypothetical protein PHW96_01640 [Candidatus Nanoarchaeia archaeon]|nr:hypothetical protein [Candidatus Nanoarchaeia archaeon]